MNSEVTVEGMDDIQRKPVLITCGVADVILQGKKLLARFRKYYNERFWWGFGIVTVATGHICCLDHKAALYRKLNER